MLVVSLAALVVVAKYTDLIDHEGQTVLEGMSTAGRGFGELPDHNIRKAVVAQLDARSQEQGSWRVVTMTTTLGVVNVDESKNLITAFGRLSVSAMCVVQSPDLGHGLVAPPQERSVMGLAPASPECHIAVTDAPEKRRTANKEGHSIRSG